jgi:tetratricopeptide (TPR) repeat protein
MLLIGGYARTSQEQDTQKTPPKPSVTTSAGIPREELKKEAELKKVMDAGQEAYRQGKYDEAISRFQEALELARHLSGKDEEQVRLFTSDEALAKTGLSYLQLHQYERAEATFTTLLDLRKQNLPFDSSVSGALVDLAQVDVMEGNLSRAEAHLAEAVAYTKECVNHFKHSDAYDAQDIVANGDRRLLAQLHTYLGNVYANQGKFDQALAAYEEAFLIGDRFKADPKSQLQIVNSALSIAQLAKREDKCEVWRGRYKGLQEKND